ncbi:MAG: hypothetical protein RLY31_1785 [Bacteroidota bacterium]
MKLKIAILSVLLPSLRLGSLQAQHTVRGCEEVTGLQACWSADLEVTTGGHFINRGTVEYTRVTNLVNDEGFSDKSGTGCAADYSDPCLGGMPERPGAAQAIGSLNVFANSVASTTISGSAGLRMYDVQLARNIQLDNEWQVACTLSWSAGLVSTDLSDPSHFLHFFAGSTVSGDSAGNRDSCIAMVTVLDTVVPTVLCANPTIYLDAMGNGSTTAAAVDNCTTDACGIASLQLSRTGFNCSHTGSNTVILTVKDNNGNSSTCQSTVTVQDAIAPVASCQPVTVPLNAAGSGSTPAAAVDNGSTDAYCIARLQLSQTAFDCSHVGNNTVTLSVMDNNGNTSTCQSTVTVQDLVAPATLCQPVTIQLDINGQASLSVAQVDNGSTDACGIDTMFLSQTAFDCSQLGPNSVTLTATDIHGNTSTCQTAVTVQDKIKPTIVCKDTTIMLARLAILNPASVLDVAASYDNCGTLLPLSVSPAQFNCIYDGPNTVTLTISDGHGNTRICQATVTVDAPDLIVSSTPENCGDFDGMITMTVLNGPTDGQWGYSIDAGDN